MHDYYSDQVGSGISIYEGLRHQRGHGIFSSFIKGKLWPILKSALPFLGSSALNAAQDITENVREGASFKDAFKGASKKQLGALAEKGLVALRNKTGMGFRRRRRKRTAVTAMLNALKKTRKTRRKRKCIKGRRRRRRTRKTSTLF